MSPDQFLTHFFSAPNEYTFGDVSGAATEELRTIKAWTRWLHQDPGQFVVLPFSFRQKDKDRKVVWCGIATTHEQYFAMHEMLQAFCGETYRDGTPLGPVRSDSAVGMAITAFTRGNYLRFTGDNEKIRQALKRMHHARLDVPKREKANQLPPGEILRRYHFALQVRNEGDAFGLIRQLDRLRVMDAVNLLFLRIHAFAVLQRWDQIHQMLTEGKLLDLRRPLEVSLALLKTIYYRELARFEEGTHVEGAIAAFKHAVYPQYGALLDQWEGFYAPEVLKLWMLKLLSGIDEDELLYDRLQHKAQQVGLNDPFWQALSRKYPRAGAVAADAHAGMLLALRKGNYATAKEYALNAKPGFEKAFVLAHCAAVLQDEDSLNAFLATKAALPGEEFVQVEQSLQESAAQFEALLAVLGTKPVPADWVSWFDRLDEDEEFAQKHAVAVAARGALTWPLSHFLARQGAVDRVVSALRRPRPAASAQGLRDALPHLLTFLGQSRPLGPELLPLFSAVFDLLTKGDALGKSELTILNELTGIMLKGKVNPERYAQLTSFPVNHAGFYKDAHAIPCLMDFVEEVLRFPVQSPDHVAALLTGTKSILAQVGAEHNVTAYKLLFNRFCRHVHCESLGFAISPAELQAALAAWGGLAGKRIGIYAAAGNHPPVEAVLNALGCNVAVQYNHDPAGSPALASMAQASDMLVVSAGRTADPAIHFIRQHRGKKDLLYSGGTGSGSVLSVLGNDLGKATGV